MIHRVFSDLQSFKNVSLWPGLNVLLADKSPGATERQTRNRAGKSSLVEIIHFLLGGNCDTESIFRIRKLVEARFGIEFDLSGVRTVVTRSGSEPSRAVIQKGDPTTWPVAPRTDKTSDSVYVSNTNWREVLGRLVFGTEEGARFGPSFRSLFMYFARRQPGGFLLPEQQSEKQQLCDQQVAVTFLLGLDWTIPQAWQETREKERALRELLKLGKSGGLSGFIGKSGDVRTQLTIADERAKQLRGEIGMFRVLPEYERLEQEAGKVTHQLGLLADDNALDRELLEQLGMEQESEAPPSFSDVESLYKEAGVVLPQAVARRFDELKGFHDSVVRNRRDYLSSEMDAANTRIALRTKEMAVLDGRRGEIMAILKSAGALDQYVKLQSELSKAEAKAESLRRQYTISEQLEGGKTELEMERAALLLRLRQDYKEQESCLKQAILAFEKVSNRLYENAGSLSVNPGPNGPEFKITIQGSRSKGINNMQIFCFDMMLMELCAQRRIGPGFLVHDSHLFDGVDERQVAKALEIGAELSKAQNFQYVVTMNSDAIPRSFSNAFNFDQYVLPVRLTDKTEDGGLFGFRF